MSARLSRAAVVACLLATWLGWGSTYLAIRFALISFPPLFQVGSRFLVAGGLLTAWSWCIGQRPPSWREWRNALIIGVVMMAGTTGGATVAERTVASGLVVAFTAVAPALITTFNLFFGVRASRLDVVGIVSGFLGVLLLVSGTSFSASSSGLLAVTVSVVSFSVGSVLSQRAFPLARGSSGYASGLVCGGAVLLALSAITGETFHWPPHPVAAMAWCYLTLIGSVLAFSAYMTLLSGTSAAIASSWTFVTPVVGMLLGVTLGGEHVTTHEWWAVAVIIAGVAVLLIGRALRPAQLVPKRTR